jgi:hypothetical protein
LNWTVTHSLFNFSSKVILAPLAGLEVLSVADISVIFRDSFFFVYRLVAFGV